MGPELDARSRGRSSQLPYQPPDNGRTDNGTTLYAHVLTCSRRAWPTARGNSGRVRDERVYSSRDSNAAGLLPTDGESAGTVHAKGRWAAGASGPRVRRSALTASLLGQPPVDRSLDQQKRGTRCIRLPTNVESCLLWAPLDIDDLGLRTFRPPLLEVTA